MVVGVYVAVFVTEGVTVIVGVRVAVAVDVCDAVAVFEGVLLAVTVGVDVDVEVAVAVGVNVAVAVGPPWLITTSCGGIVPSRDEKVTPSLPSAIRANVYVPLPDTNGVTSYSTHVFVPKAPALSDAPLNKAGCVFQVMPPVPDSIQLVSARYTAGPFTVPFVVQNTRSFTFWIGPLTSVIVKRIKLFCTVSPSA
jgi:hypothetical protein